MRPARGENDETEGQFANAHSGFVALVPDPAAAARTWASWAALLPGTNPVPLIEES